MCVTATFLIGELTTVTREGNYFELFTECDLLRAQQRG